MIRDLISIESDFWNNHVVPKVMPEPDGSKACDEVLEQEQKQIEQEIKLYMQDYEIACSDKYRVSWTNVDTARLDTKRIKAEQPEIYQDYLQTTSSRRFTIKAA